VGERDELRIRLAAVEASLREELERTEGIARQIARQRDRYRSAWTSARRRAKISDAMIGGARLYVERAQAKINMLEAAVAAEDDRYDELTRLRALTAELRNVRGWAFAGEKNQHRDRLDVVWSALRELDEAEREGRAYRKPWERNPDVDEDDE
jgi:chromosome segregation ATPase